MGLEDAHTQTAGTGNPTDPRGSGPRFRLVAGREILFDGDGFLWNPSDWDDEVAVELGVERGICRLNEDQWRAIRFLRTYYAENGRSPLNRTLTQGLGMTLLELERLFPDGIKHGARRLAGLPNPKNCV
jgi:dissimilatory sulfite reductase related protein